MMTDGGADIRTALDERPEGLVAIVTVNNPTRLNTMNSPLMAEFIAAVTAMNAESRLRALVITGAGDKAFIGGADVREMAALRGPAEARGFISRLHECCAAIRASPVPTIARIPGFVLGAGLEIAISCDARIATETAILGMPEVRLGIPSVIEAALLPTLVGWGVARRLVLFGETFDARQALAWRLVDEVAPAGALDRVVESWVDRVLSCPPRAVRLQKELAHRWEGLPLEAAVAAGIDSFAAAFETDEATTAMRRFLAGRAARKERS